MRRLLCAIPLAFAIASARMDNEMREDHRNRYLLHETCQRGLQDQINREMHASLVYQQMAAHFDNNKVARKGFSKFFKENSDEEREHAQKLIGYVNSRGGTVAAMNIEMPSYTQYSSAKAALEVALELEVEVNNALHALHRMADHDCHDPQLQDFLESHFLGEQVESIDNMHRLITVLNNMDQGIGEYLVNKDLL